jgi:hypothetical protein
LLPRVERCPSLMMGIIRESRLSILAICCDGMQMMNHWYQSINIGL